MSAESPADAWKDQVRTKLIKIFQRASEAEDLVRVLFFLDVEEKDVGKTRLGPNWRTLKVALIYDHVFKSYTKKLVEDTKRAANQEGFRQTMEIVRLEMTSKKKESGTDHSPEIFHPTESIAKDISRMLSIAAPEIIQVFLGSNAVLSPVFGGPASAAVLLSVEVIQSMRQWWNGEISGRRCCKDILQNTCSIGSVCIGSKIGATVGAAFGPIGIFAGVLCGAFIGFKVGKVSDRILEDLFNIPRREALEKSYKYFGVHKNASDAEITTAFREMCLKHHPDKGGSKEEFQRVQYYMGIIRMARGCDLKPVKSLKELQDTI